MAKSLCTTYFLWLFGGFFGLHHFYLRRDLHALAWMIFPGGYFGLGWFRELWRIPEYVRDSNEDPEYIKNLTEQMRRNPKPPSSSSRLFGQVMIGDVIGYFTLWAIPSELIEDWKIPYCAVFVPLAVALGVWLIGNVGRHQGSLYWPLIGAYITYPLYFFSITNVFWTAISSSTLFNWYGKEWRRTPQSRKPLLRRLAFLGFWLTLYLALVSSSFYFSCEFTDSNGEQVKCREAVINFFTSPLWQEFKKVAVDLYEFAKYHGWWEIWKQLLEALDPQGEANALKTLDLKSGASEAEIRSTYRKLAKQWHPDRIQDPQLKQQAQEKFIEIQKAYSTLSNIKSQRLKKNKSDRANPEQEEGGEHEEL